jgi:hypothetical protein
VYIFATVQRAQIKAQKQESLLVGLSAIVPATPSSTKPGGEESGNEGLEGEGSVPHKADKESATDKWKVSLSSIH